METWRIVLGGSIALCGIGCAVYAFIVMMGKTSLPPDRILITGSEEEKKAYKKAAMRNVASKYSGLAVFSGIIAVLAFKGSPWIILLGCGGLCGFTWLLNKFK